MRSDTDVWGSNIFAVRDALERFKKHDSSDLAQVLATLVCSKKTKPYDYAYAALGLARLPPNHHLLQKQYKQTVELFISVASFIINSRNGLVSVSSA